MKRMLIVEDDDAIRIGLCRSLSSDMLDTVGVGDLMLKINKSAKKVKPFLFSVTIKIEASKTM